MASHEGREFWERRAEMWERRADAINAFSAAYGKPAMDAFGAQPGRRVLDIGSGPGITTVEIAGRVAPGGEVVGVDISSAMVAAATRRAASAGATNARSPTRRPTRSARASTVCTHASA